MRVCLWGTRGSIASAGPDTVRYGGNTPCLEVRAASGWRYLFDAGSGARHSRRRNAPDPAQLDVDVFFTHFHWDHIQGFPFWEYLYDEAVRVRVHGPRQAGTEVEDVVNTLIQPPYFPIRLTRLGANMEYENLDGGSWTDGRVEVSAVYVNHGEHTLGYRVRAGGASLAFIPDNEVGDAPDGGAAWYRELVAFLRGVDVLYHDAMFTDTEYPKYAGWGHSSMEQAIRLAEDAEVRRLYLFHHRPDRSDDELERLAGRLHDELAARGSPLELEIATEAEEVALPGRGG